MGHSVVDDGEDLPVGSVFAEADGGVLAATDAQFTEAIDASRIPVRHPDGDSGYVFPALASYIAFLCTEAYDLEGVDISTARRIIAPEWKWSPSSSPCSRESGAGTGPSPCAKRLRPWCQSPAL